jgi:hypothetical protein
MFIYSFLEWLIQGFIQALLLTPVLEKKIQFLWRTNVALGV